MRTLLAASAALALTLAAPALATTVLDPVGDFIPSYTGPQIGGLDVVSFSAEFDGTNFRLSSTMAGPIVAGTGFYVIGVDRGAGTAGFASIGLPGVLFDSIIRLNQDGTGSVNRMPGTVNLDPGSINISGSTISAIVPLSLLPTRGFGPLNYGFNIWPRTSTVAGTAAISDFAPNNSTITAAPEPAAWALMLLGFGSVGALIRRRRAAAGLAT